MTVKIIFLISFRFSQKKIFSSFSERHLLFGAAIFFVQYYLALKIFINDFTLRSFQFNFHYTIFWCADVVFLPHTSLEYWESRQKNLDKQQAKINWWRNIFVFIMCLIVTQLQWESVDGSVDKINWKLKEESLT